MSPTSRRAKRHAIGLAVLLGALTTLVALLITHSVTAPDTDRTVTVDRHDDRPDRPRTRLTTRDEVRLATRPMLALPAEAARPRPLTRTSAATIELPAPRVVVGTWIPRRFPATPSGALAQLVAMNETGVRGGDPTTYGRAYEAVAEAGASSSTGSGLWRLLRRFRSGADSSASATPPGLSVGYEVTHGLIKGVTSGGRYAVVCTLGQLSFAYQGRTTTLGIGDCQAMHRSEGRWRIAAGVRAAYAPSAWPGSVESVQAGYRPLDRERP